MQFMRKRIPTFRGLLTIGASQFFFSLMNLCVKSLSILEKPIPAFQLNAVRMAIAYACCQILIPKRVRMWLVIRRVVGSFGLFGLYYSLRYMSLADATVLTFLSPTVTAAAGFLFLGEAVSWKQAVVGLTSLCSVVLIAKPIFIFGGSEHTDAGVGAGGPELTVVQRMAAKGVSLTSLIGVAGACAYFMTWFGILLLIGLFGFITQLLLTLGLQRETASRGTLAAYVLIVFFLMFERWVFGKSLEILSMIGTCIIIASAVYVAMNKPDAKRSDPTNTESTLLWDLVPATEEGRDR